MNPLEQALRDAFESDLDSPAERLVRDVRRGAARRRARRTTVIAAGAVAAVVASIGIGATALSRDDTGPEPTPSPTPTVSDTTPASAPVPGSFGMAAEDVGDTAWATVREDDCGCSALWSHDAGRWTRVHDFPTRAVDRLAFSPDGRYGLAADTQRVWMTSDRGATWARADVSTLYGPSYEVAVTGDRFLLHDTAGQNPAVWAPIGTDDFRPLEDPHGGVVVELFTAGRLLVLASQPPGEGVLPIDVSVSRDSGRTWTALPLPCPGEATLHPTTGAIFAACQDADTPIVHRSTGTGWEEFGRPPCCDLGLLPLSKDVVLLPTSRHNFTVNGVESFYGIPLEASLHDAATTADGTSYVTTSDGVFVSRPGSGPAPGVSWAPAG